MAFEIVRELERALGVALPTDYRRFLVDHHTAYLTPSLWLRHMVPVPGSGKEDMVTALYTARDILDSDLLGEPEDDMVVVGLVEPGGYLYMCFSSAGFGSMHIRFPFQDRTFYPVGRSFSDFRARCRPCEASDV